MSFIHFFFFNDTATTEIYTLSLHDALPISGVLEQEPAGAGSERPVDVLVEVEGGDDHDRQGVGDVRSEEHTSELQSRQYLVCRLLLEKKKKLTPTQIYTPPTLHKDIISAPP